MKLTILTGISGSGKSTVTRSLSGENTIIINRDSLRESLTGIPAAEYNRSPIPKVEKLITQLTSEIVNKPKPDYNVIVDNTNLKLKYISPLIKNWGGEVEHFLVECDPQVAKERVKKRDGYLDVDYIDKQYEDLQQLRKIIVFDGIINGEI